MRECAKPENSPIANRIFYSILKKHLRFLFKAAIEI